MPDPAEPRGAANERRDATNQPDEMYVGYLPVPRGQRVFIRRFVPVVVGVLAAVGVLWARSQPSPGRGVWDAGHTTQLRGTLMARPYPMLLTSNEDGEPEFVLLVERGKHGARHAQARHGLAVVAAGSTLKRDGRRMLELDPAESSLAADSAAAKAPPLPAPRSVGRVTLRGEIIDPKCYLGAMKPGEGKTHKACATLCIRGGIPPMFVTRDDAGRVTYYLLQSPDGGPADPAIHPFIADPVQITGDWSTSAGMNFLSIRAADIRRL